jgi:hypothetical protein
MSNWFNQAVLTTSSPTFAGLTVDGTHSETTSFTSATAGLDATQAFVWTNNTKIQRRSPGFAGVAVAV